MSNIKRWNGSAWVDAVINRWTGSAWVKVPVAKWDGTKWVVITTQIYETYYNSVASMSYKGDNSQSPSSPYDEYLMHGYYSSSNGNYKSIIAFDIATIRANLAGSTIFESSMYLKNLHSYSSLGMTAYLGLNTGTGIPSTFSGLYSSKEFSMKTTEKGQEAWVAVPTTLIHRLRDSAAGSFNMYNPDAGTSQTTYGYFAGATDVTYRPRLWVKYEK